MKDFRIEILGLASKFAIFVKAANEYEARNQAREDYPTFAIGDSVEIMENSEEHENV